MRLRRVSSTLAVDRCWDVVDAVWHAVVVRTGNLGLVWMRASTAGADSCSVIAVMSLLCSDHCSALSAHLDGCRRPRAFRERPAPGGRGFRAKEGPEKRDSDAVTAVVLHLHMMDV